MSFQPSRIVFKMHISGRVFILKTNLLFIKYLEFLRGDVYKFWEGFETFISGRKRRQGQTLINRLIYIKMENCCLGAVLYDELDPGDVK